MDGRILSVGMTGDQFVFVRSYASFLVTLSQFLNSGNLFTINSFDNFLTFFSFRLSKILN